MAVMVAATWGKAFGLYGERVGFLSVVCPEGEGVVGRVERQMKLIARAETGAMPGFGARLVEIVLGDEGERGLRGVWEEEVRGIAADLRGRRRGLRTLLEESRAGGEGWGFLTEQVGMFS